MRRSIFKIAFFVWKEFPNGFVWWKNVPIFAKTHFWPKIRKKMESGGKEASAKLKRLKRSFQSNFLWQSWLLACQFLLWFVHRATFVFKLEKVSFDRNWHFKTLVYIIDELTSQVTFLSLQSEFNAVVKCHVIIKIEKKQNCKDLRGLQLLHRFNKFASIL